MNAENMNGLKDFADNSILLDSNVIISLFANLGQNKYETNLQLKMAAITCENFLILEDTVRELYRFAQKTKIDLSLRKSFGVDYSQSLSDFDKTLDKLLDRKIFKIVKDEQIANVLSSTETVNISQLAFFKGPVGLAHDMTLIQISKLFSIPIFTYDLFILQFADQENSSTLAKFNIPIPFNKDELLNIRLDEIMDLSTPLRRLYQNAFSKIKEEVSTTEKLKANLKNKNEFISRQRNVLIDLNSDLLGAMDTIQKWKNFSKPNITETITWTMVELGLGFVPFPIPTSPINHIIQSVQYKKMERETE
jgi:hypothetical protein